MVLAALAAVIVLLLVVSVFTTPNKVDPELLRAWIEDQDKH